jgi:hypothetical protein
MFNQTNLLKYVIMFIVVTTATKVIPTCGVLRKQAVYVGLIASSTFALIDVCYPQVVVREKDA